MKESTAYEAILEKGIEQGVESGRVQEAQRILFRSGTSKLGKPGTEIVDMIESVDDAERLEMLIDALSNTTDWRELLRTANDPKSGSLK